MRSARRRKDCSDRYFRLPSQTKCACPAVSSDKRRSLALGVRTSNLKPRQLLRLLILVSQPLHKIFASVIKALQFSRSPSRDGVGRDQWHSNGGVTVADDSTGQLIRIHFPPTYGLARR